jgi:hypothetical protein
MTTPVVPLSTLTILVGDSEGGAPRADNGSALPAATTPLVELPPAALLRGVQGRGKGRSCGPCGPEEHIPHLSLVRDSGQEEPTDEGPVPMRVVRPRWAGVDPPIVAGSEELWAHRLWGHGSDLSCKPQISIGGR